MGALFHNFLKTTCAGTPAQMVVYILIGLKVWQFQSNSICLSPQKECCAAQGLVRAGIAVELEFKEVYERDLPDEGSWEPPWVRFFSLIAKQYNSGNLFTSAVSFHLSHQNRMVLPCPTWQKAADLKPDINFRMFFHQKEPTTPVIRWSSRVVSLPNKLDTGQI